MAGWIWALALAQATTTPAAPRTVPVYDHPLAGSLPTIEAAPEGEGRLGMHRGPRPGGGPVFISPMGEPFRGEGGMLRWFDGADTNHDGVLTPAEFYADADRFFAQLDRRHDGEIDPDDIAYYETMIAPEVRVGGGFGAGMRGEGGPRPGGGRGGMGGRGGGEGDAPPGESAHATPRFVEGRQGAARYSWLDYPEPVVVADTNLNRGVDRQEWRQAAEDRFVLLLDKTHRPTLRRDALPPLPAVREPERRRPGGRPRGGVPIGNDPEGPPPEH